MKPIDEIRNQKVKLEKDIYQLLSNFKTNTGAIPTAINIQTIMDLNKDDLTINNVEVTILLD